MKQQVRTPSSNCREDRRECTAVRLYSLGISVW